jgi:hypothetical protein
MAVLTATELAVLAATANRIVPARDALPGAGDLGIPTTIEQTLSQSPALRRMFLDGLHAIDRSGDEPGFAARSDDEQDALLRAVESAHPVFFDLLVEHTYRGYYALPIVQRELGLSGEPPQPRGHQLPPFDPALLTIQRQRAPFWRRVND